MDLEKDDFRTIIDDARTRHAAIVALIMFTDRQGGLLLRVFGTLGLATASGAAAAFSQQALLPRPVGFALAAATIVLVVGAGFSLGAMRSGIINLPGRGPDFWIWALRPDVDRTMALQAYLDNVVKKTRANNKFNTNTAVSLYYAKSCAAIAPAIALLAGLIAFGLGA